jgi:hypothetical protein
MDFIYFPRYTRCDFHVEIVCSRATVDIYSVAKTGKKDMVRELLCLPRAAQ